jgi:hypothetical protein
LVGLRQICERFSSDCASVWLIERNSNGTELRFVSNQAVIVLPENGPAIRYEKPAPLAWLDDRHVFVAMAESALGPLILVAGESFAGAAYPQPFDWSRRFLLLEGTEACRVVRVGPPALVQAETPPPCHRLFSEGEALYVVGDHLERTEIVVTSFRDNGQQLVPTGVRRLARPSGRYSPFFAMDISLNGSALCVRNVYDPPFGNLAPSYIYRLPDGPLRRQPFSNWHDPQLYLSKRLTQRLIEARY